MQPDCLTANTSTIPEAIWTFGRIVFSGRVGLSDRIVRGGCRLKSATEFVPMQMMAFSVWPRFGVNAHSFAAHVASRTSLANETAAHTGGFFFSFPFVFLQQWRCHFDQAPVPPDAPSCCLEGRSLWPSRPILIMLQRRPPRRVTQSNDTHTSVFTGDYLRHITLSSTMFMPTLCCCSLLSRAV